MLLLNGDCIEEMQKLIDDGVQVDSVVTDPPYHLTSITERYGKEGSAPPQDYNQSGVYKRTSTGFMGKEWDGGDIAFDPMTWSLCLGLLKPGGHLIAFSASRNYHRMAVAIENAGFEIRDQIMWLYGSGFPKSLNIGKAVDKKQGNKRESLGMYDPRSLQDGANRTERPIGNQQVANYESSMVERTKGNSEWEGWGTALKPAHEPIVLARKPLSEKSVADNVLKYGTGAINIDACRVETNPEVDDMLREVDRKERVSETWKEGSGFKNENNNLTGVREDGRYPANIMHDGLQEEWARYFYCPKTSTEERNRGLEGFSAKPIAWGNQAKAELKRGNLDFVGKNDGTKHNKVAMRVNTHPTVKPLTLMSYLITLGSRKNDVVLDPFMGSGTTPMACVTLGRNYIGVEREEEYFEIAEGRVNKLEKPMKQWDKFL